MVHCSCIIQKSFRCWPGFFFSQIYLKSGVIKAVVHIALSVYKKVLSIGGEHVVVWKQVHVKKFDKLSVHTLAWRC